MDAQKFLDDLFEGKDVAPLKRYLVISKNGKISWCDEFWWKDGDPIVDEEGDPAGMMEGYWVGIIILKDDKYVAHRYDDVSEWYDFDPTNIDEDCTCENCQPKKQEHHVMFG